MCPAQDILDRIFPPERTDAFFDALYGGAEEGAYDIHLVCKDSDAKKADLAFELRRRPGKCLKCSLTYGLPQVFQRHPIIAVAEVAQKVADTLGWTDPITWKLGGTQEHGDDLHVIPLTIEKT